VSGTGKTYASSTVHKTFESAALELRSQMKKRQSQIEINLSTADKPESDWFDQILEIACQHTGNPTEGDYLWWQIAGMGGLINYTKKNGTYSSTITYYIDYYTNATQETKTDTMVSNITAKLSLKGKSDYEIIKAVYDYICKNVAYDYDNLYDNNYTLKYTAYAAAINKKAVCQGYVLLTYRLLLYYGIDCRIISGTANGENHAWNIVKLQGKYYNIDTTWDADCIKYGSYQYFLRCNTKFPDHTRDADYITTEFNKQYPMSGTDYKVVTCSNHKWDAGKVTKAATETTTGIKTYTCMFCKMTKTEVTPKIQKANTITASNFTKTASGKAQSFSINAKVKGNAKLTYKSDKTKSVSVSSSGKITIAKNFVGKATITITSAATSTYKAASKKITITVKKAAQPLVVKSSATTVKLSNVKKKNQTVRLTVSKAQGTVSYKSSNTKYVTVSKKGVVTLKKGTPKGSYKITVTAKGNSLYNSGSKTVTITVK
jgi:hypothetical protein